MQIPSLPPRQRFVVVLLALSLVWLAPHLEIRSTVGGFLFGLRWGALVWGSVVLGLASISTASSNLLVSWFVGQTLELGIGGAIVGAALGGSRLRIIAIRVVVLVLGALVVTVALQNLGLARAVKAPNVPF